MPLNKPSPRLAILRAQLAAEADAVRMQRASYKISNAVGCSCPVPAPDADSLPLPPDYWSDLEHWLKTLAPAKPAAPEAPFPDPPQLPPVPGLALADLHAYIRDRLASTSSADGAPPVAEKLTHIVCVKSYVSQTGISFRIGQVVGMTMADVLLAGRSEYWRACDESGWIPHEYGSACQARCFHEVRIANGEVGLNGSWEPNAPPDRRIVAWLPIAQS